MPEPLHNGACEMRRLEMPSAWAGLGNSLCAPVLPACTFSIPYKGFVFSGVHSLEIEDEIKPIVVTIEQLFIDDSCKDVLAIIDPAITYWLEDELARN